MSGAGALGGAKLVSSGDAAESEKISAINEPVRALISITLTLISPLPRLWLAQTNLEVQIVQIGYNIGKYIGTI
jgi:hypothetical protein